MALQYSDDRQPNNNNRGGLRASDYISGRVVAGGSTTTIERPTGGSVTQSGSGINTDTATDSIYTNDESPAYGGGRTSSGSTQTVANPINRGTGTNVSTGFMGGGGGGVVSNNETVSAVRAASISINPLYLLLIPLVLLIWKK